ncbi:response regulator transcription factor [Arabiibacter massiliensis]|uniref:response regulator transcription factor n=1 Tax=Arabiibacter massiliensis TaxID=1870985 RepID=UPI0009BC4358|nr:helix-turn-helix transcriptional regulator [Arabiibacter massiliensis]
MRDDAPGATRDDNPSGWRFGAADVAACASLALLLISAFILNAYLFPSLAALFPAGREISTYCGAAFSVLVAVLAYRRPAAMREGAWSVACLALFAGGLALLYVGLAAGSPVLVALGSPFGGIGAVWFSVLAGLALIKRGPKRSMVIIPTAFVAKYAVQFGLTALGGVLPLAAALVLYFICTAPAYLLIRPHVHGIIETIRASESPTVLDATNPSSFLPFSSLVYVSIFLFNAACGFAFASQGEALSQTATLVSFAPVVVVFFVVVAARARLSADALYQASALLVFAGFLLAPLALAGGAAADRHASSALLYAGSDSFSVLTYYLIAAVGARNPVGALSTSAFAFAANWLGIGCGALVAQGIGGLGAHELAPLLWASALVTFLFMLFNFVVMRGFSFEETIQGVKPAHIAAAGAAAVGEDEPSPTLDDACEAAIARFALTPREGDVLRLLARGRTSPVIQEKLFLSHNTVKTHVRHIYAKMGIHSQQELIDIVETEALSS